MMESNIYINVCQSLLPTNVAVKDVAGYIFKPRMVYSYWHRKSHLKTLQTNFCKLASFCVERNDVILSVANRHPSLPKDLFH